ncbi:MAG: PD-(D/E)XK nuclease family protein [bacterium]
MNRRLLLAPFGCDDVTQRLFAAALAEVAGPDYRGILYLAPNQRKRRAAEHEFAAQCGRAGFIPPQFLTPGQLADRLFESSATGRHLRSSLRPLLVRRLTAPSGAPPTLGYARAVAEFIADIKTWVPADERTGLAALFAEQLAGHPKPLERALEALNLLGAYDAELRARGRFDDEDVAALKPGFVVASGLCPRVLILDGFADPNPLESGLVAALVEAAGATVAACWAGDPEDEDYALAGRFRAFLEGLGGFATERLECDPAPAPAGLCVFPDREAQLEGIARHLRALPDLTDTVLALPDLGACAPLVRRVFEQYGVPATLYPDVALDASPPVVAVLELLHAIETGFERLPLAAALSSDWLPGLLRLPGDSGDAARRQAAAAVNSISRRAGIIKGATNWRNICERLEAAEGWLESTDKALCDDLQQRVRRAIGLAQRMLEPADTLGRQASRLKAFLEAAEFGRGESAGLPEAEPLLEDRGALYDVLDELVAFEADFGASTESRRAFVRTLEYLIGLERGKAEPAPAGVLVVGLTETLNLHPRRLVVGGLTESNLPGSYRTDPILPDRLRRLLGIPDIDRHRDRQRFHLRATVESSLEPPLLCAFESDGGNPVLPTPFLQLQTLKPPAPGPYCAAIEEQLDAGARAGQPFAELPFAVDFKTDQAVRTALAARFGASRAISVTAVEAFRACPYRFYLERVLGVESPPEPQFQIDNLQWGTVIHDALGRLYAKGPVPLSTLESRARAALDAVLREAGLPAFWAETARRVFDNILPGIMRVETELRSANWQPQKTELSLEGTVAKDIRIKGRLDRLDEHPDGLRVLDYKTGQARVSARDVVERRTHVQLPLYAKLIAGETGRPVDNVGIYSLREQRIRWLAGDDHPLKELVRAALETTVEVMADIRSGRFAAEPADEATCRHCDYAYLCGAGAGSGEA